MNPDEMTPEQVNVAIAKLCGWKLVPEGSANPPSVSFRMCPVCNYYGSRHEGRSGMAEECHHDSEWVAAFDQWTMDGVNCEDYPPNYHGSLDAMAQARSTLNDEEQRKYSRALRDAICERHRLPLIHSRPDLVSDFEMIHATAAQHAVAFLRVKSAKVIDAQPSIIQSPSSLKKPGK